MRGSVASLFTVLIVVMFAALATAGAGVSCRLSDGNGDRDAVCMLPGCTVTVFTVFGLIGSVDPGAGASAATAVGVTEATRTGAEPVRSSSLLSLSRDIFSSLGGFPSFDDLRSGSFDRGDVDVAFDQAKHARIASAGCAAAEDDRNDMMVGAAYRRDDVESGLVDVTGLDAVDAVDRAEQMVMVADRIAAIVERARGEIAIVIRKAILDRPAKRRLIARGGDLLVVGQAGGVAVDRLRHTERACFRGHHFGKARLVAAERFRHDDGDIVGRLCDDRADRGLDAD